MSEPEQPPASATSESGDGSERPWENYKIGERCQTGGLICEILSSAPSSFIFLDDTGDLQWEYADDKPRGDEASSLAFDLVSRVRAAGLGRRAKRQAFSLIGAAIASAIDDASQVAVAVYFADAREFVTQRQEERGRLAYVAAGGLGVATVALLGLIVRALEGPPGHTLWIVAVLCGAVGAFVSVAQRSDTLTVNRYASRVSIVAGALIRVALGGLFGGVLVALVRAGIVAPAAADNRYLMSILAMAAGVNERWIPSLLETAARNNTPPSPGPASPPAPAAATAPSQHVDVSAGARSVPDGAAVGGAAAGAAPGAPVTRHLDEAT